MTGRFIAVVGPSGVGKDSVMAEMAKATPRIHLARRVITRPVEALGEDFDAASVADFTAMRDARQFALCWPAHGLFYAIPKEVDAVLAQGKDVLANLSRSVLVQAKHRFSDFSVLALTADRKVLEQRLTARAREDAADIALRLERSTYALPPEITAVELDNSGPLDQTVAQALRLLYPVRA